MAKTVSEPRPRLKPTAPRMEVVRYTFDQHKDIFTLVRLVVCLSARLIVWHTAAITQSMALS